MIHKVIFYLQLHEKYQKLMHQSFKKPLYLKTFLCHRKKKHLKKHLKNKHAMKTDTSCLKLFPILNSLSVGTPL